MQKIINVWNWLVTSSMDPSKTALTVKSFLTTVGGVLILISPLVHLQIGDSQVSAMVNAISQFVVIVLTVVASLATLFGFIRKIANTDWKNQPPTSGPAQ